MHSEMNPILGPLFPLEEVEDLELLTDLLDVAGDPLGVVFAVASHLEKVPRADEGFGPLLRKRLGRNVQQLWAESLVAGRPRGAGQLARVQA